MATLSENNNMNITSSPGISSYGQRGATGYTGEDGGSIYFSAYTDYQDILNRISISKSLSNNPDYNETVKYNAGDVILDINGNLRVYNGVGFGDASSDNVSQNIFDTASSFKITATCVLDAVDEKRFCETNPYYVGDYDSDKSSPWICHRDRYKDAIAGSWFKITVSSENVSEYSYKFNIIFPNGNIITSTDYTIDGDDAIGYTFVDNRFLYECHHISDNNTIDGDGKTALIHDIAYNGIYNNNEYNSRTSINCNRSICEWCTLDVEIESLLTGKTYRYSANLSNPIKDPTFQQLRIIGTLESEYYTENTNVFCSSTALAIPYIKHGETNVDMIKEGTITININGDKLKRAATTNERIEISGSFERTINRSQWYIELTGTDVYDIDMIPKKIVLTAYMPVYCFVSPSQEESSVSGGLVEATAEIIAYTGGETIDKTCTIAKGGAWCVALPSHMTMESIGTITEFNTRNARTATTTYNLTRDVNGIKDVSYTVYLLPMKTAQNNIDVRIITKALYQV